MAELPICDKCMAPVEPGNDAEIISRIYLTLIGNDQGYYMHQSSAIVTRHFLRTDNCEGSPSRSQYIEGEARDSRGMTYYQEEESFWREAYRQSQQDIAS